MSKTNPVVELLQMNDGTSFSLFQRLVCSPTVMISYLPGKILCRLIFQKLSVTCCQIHNKRNLSLSFTNRTQFGKHHCVNKPTLSNQNYRIQVEIKQQSNKIHKQV